MPFVRSLKVAAVCACCSGFAFAADKNGYLSLSGGFSIPSGNIKESGVASDVGTPLPDDEVKLDNGWIVAAGLGSHLGDSFRIEGQYTAQVNEVDSIEYFGAEHSADGTFCSNLFMANLYYDYEITKYFSAYVGVGAGAVFITWDASYGANDFEPSDKQIDNNDGWGFAYQVMIGVAYEVFPNIELTGGYRGWSATDFSTQFADIDMPWMHIAEVGVRFSF